MPFSAAAAALLEAALDGTAAAARREAVEAEAVEAGAVEAEAAGAAEGWATGRAGPGGSTWDRGAETTRALAVGAADDAVRFLGDRFLPEATLAASAEAAEAATAAAGQERRRPRRKRPGSSDEEAGAAGGRRPLPPVVPPPREPTGAARAPHHTAQTDLFRPAFAPAPSFTSLSSIVAAARRWQRPCPSRPLPAAP